MFLSSPWHMVCFNTGVENVIRKHLEPLVTTGNEAEAWREQYTKEVRLLQWGEVADLRALEEKHRGH